MPAPATADEFLDLVRKSGVADEPRLKAYLQRQAEAGGAPTEPSKLAGVLVRDGLLTYFQADQLLQGKWKRFSIGKYKVLERIGAGGMGQVFLCEHKLMRRRVAVKVLPAAKSQDPASLDRFYREARAVAAVDHPNIVRAYDIDQDDNLHFLVMEYVDGTNLQDLVKKFAPLDVTRACHYIYGAAVGLQHAHEMGLVHRDIKPGNVLIDRAGVVKILDMGLARFFHDDDDQLTRNNDENILGTADYLAPEQAIDSHSVDIRADLYSLGGTFYYLLTGQAPFPEGTVAQKLLWHQTREPAPVRTLRPEVPEGVAAVVVRLMAKDPAKRYQTPAEVMTDLAPWVQVPIPPPDEKELPRLSIAAMGTGGPVTSKVSIAPPMTAGGLPASDQYLTPATGVRREAPLAPRAAPPSAKTVSTMTAVAPAVAQPPTAPAEHPAAPQTAPVSWDDLTADTRTDARADTDDVRPPSSIRRRPDGGERKPRRRVPLLALGGAIGFGLVCVVGLVAYLAFGGKSTHPPGPQVPGEGRRWYVSKGGTSPDPERTLTTLRGALEQALANDVVVILEDRIEEPPLAFSDRGTNGKRKGVRVEAGNPARAVTWAPRVPAGRPTAAFEVTNAENFKLSGVTFDLGGTVEFGVAIGGGCPGLTVEGVTVRNPRTGGFRAQYASGEAGRPVELKRCRVAADPSAKIEAGVLFGAGNRHVTVDGCRFEGPGQAGVKVTGPVSDTEVRNCRLYNFDYGVYLTDKLAPEATFGLTVANNTFYAMGTAGLGSDLPLAGPKQQLTLTRNYFAKSAQLVTTPGPNLPGLKPSDNVRDATKEGNVNIGAIPVEDYELPPPNPADDAQFLRSPAGSKLSAVGPNKVAAGAQP